MTETVIRQELEAPASGADQNGQPTLHRWTRKRYEQAVETGVFDENDRVELVNGILVEMSPQSSRHSASITLADEAIRKVMPTTWLIRTQLPLSLDTVSQPEPDIAVVDGSPRDFVDAHPETALLVVEVSDRTLDFDRHDKQAVYARAGIPVYWIVNLKEKVLEVYEEPSGERYRTVRTFDQEDEVHLPRTQETVSVSSLLP